MGAGTVDVWAAVRKLSIGTTINIKSGNALWGVACFLLKLGYLPSPAGISVETQVFPFDVTLPVNVVQPSIYI